MAAEAARVYNNANSAYYGSAIPAEAPYVRPAVEPDGIPAPRERTRPEEKTKAAAAQSGPAISLFAVFGTIFVGILMFFVVLAQINYNEIASETARLNSQFDALIEQERILEIDFENVIDIKEVERYAKDTLGMSKPDADQTAAVRGIALDSAEIIDTGEEDVPSGNLSSFLSSLLNYFR